MTELNIVPECYVDTKLAEIVSQASGKYNHQHGCGDVANKLLKSLLNHPALGIIDQDKNKGPQAKYLEEFKIIATQNNLILKKHPLRTHFLIVICPEIEKWLMANALTCNITPTDYGLPNELKGFLKISKVKDIDKNEGFRRFIKQLVKADAPGIITLKTWIELFNKNNL